MNSAISFRCEDTGAVSRFDLRRPRRSNSPPRQLVRVARCLVTAPSRQIPTTRTSSRGGGAAEIQISGLRRIKDGTAILCVLGVLCGKSELLRTAEGAKDAERSWSKIPAPSRFRDNNSARSGVLKFQRRDTRFQACSKTRSNLFRQTRRSFPQWWTVHGRTWLEWHRRHRH
jgi:hypothetical protein